MTFNRRGGSRSGAGRKPSGRKTCQVRMSEKNHTTFILVGGSDWLNFALQSLDERLDECGYVVCPKVAPIAFSATRRDWIRFREAHDFAKRLSVQQLVTSGDVVETGCDRICFFRKETDAQANLLGSQGVQNG